jgi:anionic cell wall polymer biosynthesis LytR-Cps2A-Psr (LCP) family protein
MTTLTPQAITEIKDFLKEQQKVIMTRLTAESSIILVDLVFKLLHKELDIKFQEEVNKEADYYGYSR